MAETGLIVARAALYATLLPAAGLPLYLVTAGRAAALTRTMRGAIALFAVAAFLVSLWWALASVAAMAAMPVGDLDRDTVTAVLGATPLGMALEVRAAALALLVLALLARLRSLAALAGLAALATAAFTGHAGATEGGAGTLHRLADTIHLAAAACWIGALLTLLAGAFGAARAREFEARLARFALTGTGIVALLLGTGIVNTLLIAGWPLPWSSPWTALLATKLVLFTGMLGLAALNRWRLTPALARSGSDPAPRRHLRASLLVETGLSLGILILVSALGVLDPAGAA